MVDFTVPYAMDGTVLPGEALRRQQQDVVGEGSGVVRAADLKIVPLDVPGQGVKIMPGHDLIQSRAPGRDRETYGVQLNTAQNYMGDDGAGIPGTGSSGGRRDMIIHEILNPEEDRHFTPQENWPAGATSKLSVVQNVPADAVRVDQVPALNEVTCYEVTAINWPASTGTITAAMLEDLRTVQNPFRSEFRYARPRIAADDGKQAYLIGKGSDGGEFWPGGAGVVNQFQAFIPRRATQMGIDARWLSLFFKGNPFGDVWMEFGTESRPHTWPNKQQYEFATQKFAFNAPDSADVKGANLFAMDTVPVPAKLRGKLVTFVFKGSRRDETQVTNPAHQVWMGARGGLGCVLTFAEVAQGADAV